MGDPTLCSIDDCRLPVKARGWCPKHYGRWARSGDPLTARRYNGPSSAANLEPAERIWGKFRRTEDGCWTWTAAILPNGYGSFGSVDQSNKAHRAVYELIVGPIPAGLHLDHLCRNRACVNPAHLEPVTCAENIRRGHGNGSEQQCPQGHPYNDLNTYRWTDPKTGYTRRYCRACKGQAIAV